APRAVKYNNAKEEAARRPTIKKLGPPSGTIVEAELRPANMPEAEPLKAVNRVDKCPNLYFPAPATIPEDWPPLVRTGGAPENTIDYVARYRVLPADAIPAARPARATRAEVEALRAEVAVLRERCCQLERELEDAPRY